MMKIIATAKRGVAIGLLYCFTAAGLLSGAEEPATKEPEKPSPSKQAEPAKPVEPKPTDSKPPETKAPSQTPPSKSPETKSPETKAPEAKAPEPPKAPDSKPAPVKPTEQKESSKTPEKAPESKPADAKGTTAPAPPAKPAETKGSEPAKPPLTPIVSIKLALMSDPRLFPYDISVDMNGETAILSGKVGSETEKAAATEIAQSMEGVKSVTNNLEIVKDLPQTLMRKKDEAITQYVKDRFAKSKTLESAHFDIKTEDGIVLLSGKTKFLVIALEAAEAARQIPGVKAVKSEGIRVESPE